MRSHSALYIDAGYLLAATATRVTGSSLRRGVRVEYAALLAALAAHVESQSRLPLLRSHWYDAARDGTPTREQEQIVLLPNVKLRPGGIGEEGEQRGSTCASAATQSVTPGMARSSSTSARAMTTSRGRSTKLKRRAYVSSCSMFLAPTGSACPSRHPAAADALAFVPHELRALRRERTCRPNHCVRTVRHCC